MKHHPRCLGLSAAGRWRQHQKSEQGQHEQSWHWDLLVEWGRHCRPPCFGGASFDNTSVDGAFVDGAFVDGAFVDGAFVDGAFVDGAFVDGAFVDVVLASRVVDQSRARATPQVRYTLATQLVLSAP
jgi:hypothetical protein